MKYSFEAVESVAVLDFLSDKIGGVSLNSFKKLLKCREIKVNGIRIAENVFLKAGDEVDVFVPAAMITEAPIIEYEDMNIIVVFKPPLITVEGGLTELLKDKYSYVAPVHRLDRNTKGLVVFAKNKDAESILLTAFKERTINKKYRALIYGEIRDGIYKAYLFKDAKKGICYVSDTFKTGYKEIITGCKAIKKYGGFSDVELTLITGRTHQLRAHMSHLGYPIVGDDKYGDRALNKAAGVKLQQLTAVSIEFSNLPPPLNNLNQKKIILDFQFDRVLVGRLESLS